MAFHTKDICLYMKIWGKKLAIIMAEILMNRINNIYIFAYSSENAVSNITFCH